MKITVLGAGMMGSAVAYDLARMNPGSEIVLADRDMAVACKAAEAIGSGVTPMELDVNDSNGLRAALRGSDAAVSSISYAFNLAITRAAIEAGVPVCDLGGNDDVVRQQIALHDEAKRAGIAVVPDCGLAPGLAGILAVRGAQEFDELDAIRMRVGGLPQHPVPPLNYQIVFSAEGLINEYVEPAEVIHDGACVKVPSMTGLESIVFPPPFGELEAFFTSGGASLLPRSFAGRVKNLDYKTIRYPGHCEKFRMLLDLGFAESEPVIIGSSVRTRREIFTDLLRNKLSYGDEDLVLLRVTVTGRRQDRAASLAYELIDYYDTEAHISAMMRTTAYPTSIIARMLARKDIRAVGVFPPEDCVPADALINELEKRQIHITRTDAEV